MSSMRTQEQVVTDIQKEREELVSAVAEVRRDMTREIEHLRTVAKQQLPKVAVGVALVVAAVVVRRIRRARQAEPVSIERARVGRFSLVEHV